MTMLSALGSCIKDEINSIRPSEHAGGEERKRKV